MNIDTRVARFEPAPGDPYRPTSTPLYQTATFEQESADEFGEYDYSRSGNPTRAVLERQIASLESGRFGFAFSSGMAAISTVLRATLLGEGRATPVSGDLFVGQDLYGGTTRLIERILAPRGVNVHRADTTDVQALRRCLENASPGFWLFLESPSNPLLHVSDIEGVGHVVHESGGRLIVDNTALSLYLQNPLELGADLVLHSATKHLGGHGDVTAGVVATNDELLADALTFLQNAEGNALPPFDSWLLLRGLKTLGVRLKHECASALELARFLERSSFATRVYYPGLDEHPGREILERQARGYGQLLSFETGDVELSRRICEETSLFTIAVSFGSANSTISLPCRMSHASVPESALASGRVQRLPRDLVRVSVGLEDVEDLISDLESTAARKCIRVVSS